MSKPSGGEIVRYAGVVESDTPTSVYVANAAAFGVTSPDGAIDGAKRERVTETPEAAGALAAATVTDAIAVPQLLLRGAAMSHAATEEPRIVGKDDAMEFWSALVESSHVVAYG